MVLQEGGGFLAATSTFSFPRMFKCPGIHIRKTEALDWDKEWHNIYD